MNEPGGFLDRLADALAYGASGILIGVVLDVPWLIVGFALGIVGDGFGGWWLLQPLVVAAAVGGTLGWRRQPRRGRGARARRAPTSVSPSESAGKAPKIEKPAGPR